MDVDLSISVRARLISVRLAVQKLHGTSGRRMQKLHAPQGREKLWPQTLPSQPSARCLLLVKRTNEAGLRHESWRSREDSADRLSDYGPRMACWEGSVHESTGLRITRARNEGGCQSRGRPMNWYVPQSPGGAQANSTLKARQVIGKYRIRRRIGVGAFATVYEAYDTIEGIPVALKIPHVDQLDRESLNVIHREVRLTARLVHENILPLRNAMMIDDHFVIATPLGKQTLTERLRHRLGPKTALSYSEQLVDALSYAHEQRIIHCDIKPDNVIIFADGQVRLADFGIAKVALRTRTIMGSGQGTVGYIAPEQAMGKPSFRSDVFSMGLVIYRLFAGELPEWPFDWPLPGADRLRRTASRDFIDFLRRAIEVRERKRFRDGTEMQEAFEAVAPRALRGPSRRRSTTP